MRGSLRDVDEVDGRVRRLAGGFGGGAESQEVLLEAGEVGGGDHVGDEEAHEVALLPGDGGEAGVFPDGRLEAVDLHATAVRHAEALSRNYDVRDQVVVDVAIVERDAEATVDVDRLG